MNPFEKISSIAASGLRAQAYRLQVVSENLANADTNGYRRKLVTFGNELNRATGADEVRVTHVFLDSAEGKKIYEPDHPLADEKGYVTLSNVNMLTEFADAREANQSYEAGLSLMRQAKQMYSSLLDILRR